MTKVQFLLLILIVTSCKPTQDNSQSRIEFINKIPGIKHFVGDSLTFELTKDGLDKFEPVDSLFYQTFLSKNEHFKGFNVSDLERGGPNCSQYYYGIIKNRITGYSQILILQIYAFNDVLNDLFLLTFDEHDSLRSVLPVASLVFQTELEPIFKSKMLPDNSIIKQEVTTNNIPDSIDNVVQVKFDSGEDSYIPSDSSRFQICADSIIKKYKFEKGIYRLVKYDSFNVCHWELPKR
jgi:hypothetical protein